MKKSSILIIIVSLGIISTLTGQTDTTIVVKKDSVVYADTVRQRAVQVEIDRRGENNYVKIVRRKKVRTRISLVEFGLNGLANTGGYTLEDGINPFDLDVIKSSNLTYFPYMQRISIIRRYFNLIHGLGIEYHEYNFQNSVTLEPRMPQASFINNPDLIYKKNKLKVMYLSIPVMLNIETNPERYGRSFRISGGLQGGLRIRSWTKQKSNDLGKVKAKDDFNLNRFKVALRGEVGVGAFNLFGTVNMTELFDPEQNGGYKVYPFTIGIKVLPF